MELKKTIQDVVNWISSQVSSAGKSGAVLGLSGGIDSGVVAALACKSLGPEKVTPMILPCQSHSKDAQDARKVAEFLGLESVQVDLTVAYNSLMSVLPSGSALANANIKPRLRMITLYHRAQSLDALVLGTGNRTEIAVGYFTKHGDGAADLLPLASFTKTEVRDMATHLGLPQWLVDRPPSAGLWEGQTDEKEMGIQYRELDEALVKMANKLDHEVPEQVRSHITRKMLASEHKRRPIPVFELQS